MVRDLFGSMVETPRAAIPPAGAASGRFVRVAIERGMDRPDGLTYGLPVSMADIEIGERVEAPLGRRDARAAGFVVEIDVEPDFDPRKIKPLLRRTGAKLPGSLLELARWMSKYYCCPLGMVLGTMVPAAVKKGTGEITRIEVEPTGVEPAIKLPPTAGAAWERLRALPAHTFPITAKKLATMIEAPSVGPINRLVKLGLLREVERKRIRAAWAEHAVEPDRTLVLTKAQREAVEGICATLGEFSAHLVRGVTGSGKTELYLRVLERVIERGECAIVLVPEISLTPQTAGRFIGRFQHVGVAVLHSGLTASQRHQQWSLVSSGSARIVVGARSAIFAPFDRIGATPAKVGLIVVDEEHDGAYKQDQLPRYQGRDVAIKRAQIEGCPIVLGSATPSLESWRNAQLGKFKLYELRERPAGAVLPQVEIVDLAEERRARPWRENRVSLIGPRLEGAIGRALGDGGQVILLLNRRGYANYICCPDHRCGWLMTCDYCDVTMVYHKDGSLKSGGVVRCHHCLAEQSLPALCPVCGNRVNTFGMGTQRVEEELADRFPELVEGETMLRLDGDTTRSGREWHDALGRFGRGELKLLVGTQMIAKGLDYPNVHLVGIVNADTAINLPDFRAAERTFQLVSQVAGRAGRSADRKGRVIVQTFGPQTPAIRMAAEHDYLGFAEEEMATRVQAGLPPATRMGRIVVRDKDLGKANGIARSIAESLHRHAGKGADAVRIMGPMPAPLSRIGGLHRVAIELIADSPGPLQRAITGARNEGFLKSDNHTAVDIDPVALL